MGEYFAPETKLDLPAIPYTVESAGRGVYAGARVMTGGEFTGRIFRNEVEAKAGAGDEIQFLVKFWTERLEDRYEPNTNWVIDQRHYIIGAPTMRPPYGHGGRAFWIQPLIQLEGDDVRLTPTVIHTRNLWSQGRIPDWFKTYLPDTGKFVWPVPDAPDTFTDDPNIAFPNITFSGWRKS